MHGLDLGVLVQELGDMDREAHFLPPEVLDGFNVAEVVGYILSTHHSFLYRELQRLEDLLGEAGRIDGTAFPLLLELLDPFLDFKKSLEWHMREEERNLFPYFLQLVEDPKTGFQNLDEIESLTRVFEAEEERVLVDLADIRKKTRGYLLPGTAGSSTRELFHDLARMEIELSRHIHDENQVLYPKVRALCRKGEERYRFHLSPSVTSALGNGKPG
jgi:regulator of cell morphogenesis and NO signaling